MNIELGQLPDGDLALVCGAALPADVKRVEYYRAQRLFMLVYDLPDHDGELMHYELEPEVAQKVQRCSSLVEIEPNKKIRKSHRVLHLPDPGRRMRQFCPCRCGLDLAWISYRLSI